MAGKKPPSSRAIIENIARNHIIFPLIDMCAVDSLHSPWERCALSLSCGVRANRLQNDRFIPQCETETVDSINARQNVRARKAITGGDLLLWFYCVISHIQRTSNAFSSALANTNTCQLADSRCSGDRWAFCRVPLFSYCVHFESGFWFSQAMPMRCGIETIRGQTCCEWKQVLSGAKKAITAAQEKCV